MEGVLGYSTLPLVSSDFQGTTYSSVLDALSTMMMDAYALENRWLLREEDMQKARNEGTAAYLQVREAVP